MKPPSFFFLYSFFIFSFLDAKINILDSYVLDLEHDGKRVCELSALAYKDERLYALSDRGLLYTFAFKVKDKKIKRLSLLDAKSLRNTKFRRFSKNKRDSEGLDFYKDGFLISFEDKNRVLYTTLDGKKIKKMQVHPLLEHRKNYQSHNKGLESVAWSEVYGVLTIPELPLKNSSQMYHTLYAKERTWKFQAQGSITDIVLMDRRHLLVLLRQYNFFEQGRKARLICLDLEACAENEICSSETVAVLDSLKGDVVENFEGITKIKKGIYLMVSDDNNSFFQKTLFVLFEIIR
jgi:hypothetical protein